MVSVKENTSFNNIFEHLINLIIQLLTAYGYN